jgi:putative Holliday junction resolvase
MKLLAIDYGEKKVGLAISGGILAEPLSVINFGSEKDLADKIKKIAHEREIEKIVVGMPKGRLAKKIRKFGGLIKKETGLPVVFEVEEYTTKDAIQFAIEAGIKRKKRRAMEDAYSAALILQNYLDR